MADEYGAHERAQRRAEGIDRAACRVVGCVAVHVTRDGYRGVPQPVRHGGANAAVTRGDVSPAVACTRGGMSKVRAISGVADQIFSSLSNGLIISVSAAR
jgi:hypothetical protein